MPPLIESHPRSSARRGASGESLGLVHCPAHDELTHGYVRTIHPGLRGQNMWISTRTVLRGPALLHEHPHLVEQLVMFMRRHLTAHHLAWIAEHGSQRQDCD